MIEDVFEVGVYGLAGFHFEVVFDDAVAHEQSDALDACVADLAALDGVQAAVREDRELVLVRAPDLDELRLADWLRGWWRARGSG